MKKELDIEFVLLLQNETFLQMVKDTNRSVNQLDLLNAEFPGMEQEIAYAVGFLGAGESDQKMMNPADTARILENIKQHAYSADRKAIRTLRVPHFWKVAAALILILGSSLLIYERLNPDTLTDLAMTKSVIKDDAMIILSDGSHHQLTKKDSLIEYSANGGVVMVKGEEQVEKLENNTSSKAASFNQIIVPFGQRHSITLSDGTHVQLNAGSRLVFPAEFSGNKREVFLKGEGYFEVSKSRDKPFIVKTNFVDIKVLGTVFNISAYDDEQITSAVLVEGKVVVRQKNKLFGTTEKNLSPGEGCFYSSVTSTSDIRKVDIYEYVSWKDGVFLFKDKSLVSIVGRLEKYYKRKISVEGENLQNTLISGKLVLSEDLDKVMHYLSKTMETRYFQTKEGDFIIKNQYK